MAKGSGMKKVNVTHCKPMRAGGLTRPGVSKMPAQITGYKSGGMVVRGTGCAVKGKKATGPNG